MNEAYHLALGAAMLGWVAWVVARRRYVPYALIVLGCLLNLYLVLVQRYNRARLHRAMGRRRRRRGEG